MDGCELARLGWTKMSKSSTDDMKKEVDANLAEVHLALGEVAMDCSNYTQAQEDFQACISLKKTVLPADARSLAKSFQQLGVCQAMSGKFPKAESSLTAAISVLEARTTPRRARSWGRSWPRSGPSWRSTWSCRRRGRTTVRILVISTGNQILSC